MKALSLAAENEINSSGFHDEEDEEYDVEEEVDDLVHAMKRDVESPNLGVSDDDKPSSLPPQEGNDANASSSSADREEANDETQDTHQDHEGRVSKDSDVRVEEIEKDLDSWGLEAEPVILNSFTPSKNSGSTSSISSSEANWPALEDEQEVHGLGHSAPSPSIKKKVSLSLEFEVDLWIDDYKE